MTSLTTGILKHSYILVFLFCPVSINLPITQQCRVFSREPSAWIDRVRRLPLNSLASGGPTFSMRIIGSSASVHIVMVSVPIKNRTMINLGLWAHDLATRNLLCHFCCLFVPSPRYIEPPWIFFESLFFVNYEEDRCCADQAQQKSLSRVYFDGRTEQQPR